MKTLPREWPENVEPFCIGRWSVDRLDQKMLETMRRIADDRNWTIEEVMDDALAQFVERLEAERELETKILPFPT
jgi:hypothetical protein